MNTNLKNNIYKDYLFTFLSRFDLTHGIWMLYLAYKGLNLFEIGLMETVYHLSSFTMEIPTGAVADILGRKTSRVLGRIMSCVAILIMIFGNNVYAFALSFFFTALSNNLESGAGEALVYDSLKEIKEEHLYIKIRGRNEFFYQLTKTLSLLLGGYIATLSYNKVYIFSLVVAFVSVMQALTFVEPTIGKVEKKESAFKTFIHQIKSSSEVLKNEELLEMILALEIFSTFYTTEFFYMQNHLKALGHSEFHIGIILSIGALFAAITATQAYKLEKRFKLKHLISFAIITAIIAFWGMPVKGIEKYAFIALSAVEGLMFVVLSDYINKLIPSDKRATVLSFQSMIFSVFMIALFPLVGKIGDIYSLQTSFVVIAGISSLILLAVLRIISKRKAL
ncbi:MFS transporter [Acidaminobacter sp. JC074]|uniref:MFS transporter n=1 Tax=Acidaminobacter sp. JC074 TaxID=2530199 RepID=UPI001F105644|nr:MFS transporter [Acidaminobacter sp. JC074]MCH4890971.1 MFS transporter [Acidaminobacter sp. JC074]